MQIALNLPLPMSAYDYGARASGESHGVVLTKPHVVELILDLAGYTVERDLTALRLLEPSSGPGAFLVAAVRRLLASARARDIDPGALRHCITAFDIDKTHVRAARKAVAAVLHEAGVSRTLAGTLTRAWIRAGDFLLAAFKHRFDVIVGNPPYVRIEQLAPVLHEEYRRRYQSLYDRADLYVAFIERGLSLLQETGLLSFICADRWTSNKYGTPLRRLITNGYCLHCYIDLHNASPFESEVIAYPSIVVLGPGKTGSVPVITLDTASAEECARVRPALARRPSRGPGRGAKKRGKAQPGVSIARYESWFKNDEPWVLSSPVHLAALRDLEHRFAPICTTARVGIGVATGNDRRYLVGDDCDIEDDRLVPLVMRDNIKDGRVTGARTFVINTFDTDGRVIDLDAYPRLKSYFAKHGAELKKRHVAGKNPRAWFRTIDRVYPELVPRPKLLIPDIAGSNQVAFDPGHFHPHHNLYFVVSDIWDMEVLGGLLSSRVALFFVWSYAARMRGGYLRFQAQYLRRICLPAPDTVGRRLAGQVRDAFRARDFARLDTLALKAYQLDELPDFDFVDTRT